jgi:hypothetical protein
VSLESFVMRAVVVHFSSPNTSRSAISFTISRASERDSEGTPPEEGTVIPVRLVTFVRMLPNLSQRAFGPLAELVVGESKRESAALVVVALVAVLAIEDRLGGMRALVVGAMHELGERAGGGGELGEEGGREICLFEGTLAAACVPGAGKLEDGDIVTDTEPDVRPAAPAPEEPLRPVRIGMMGGVGDSLFALALLDPAEVAVAAGGDGARSKLGVDALAAAFPLFRLPATVPRSTAC